MADSRQLSLAFADHPAPPTPPPPPAPPRAPAERPAPLRTPFNYTQALRDVLADIVATLPELRHVDLTRVGVAMTQARQSSRHGTYATCVPLRFEGGAPERAVGGRVYRMQTVRWEGVELLYVLYFVLPRFHEETDYREKLATIIHELYHISPAFDGDLRRFPGKNFAHGHSRERYHAAMRVLADQYLAASPRAQEHEFLKVPFADLLRRPGGVVGQSISRPRAVLVRTGRAKP
jgi:predicted metallopeptidase